MSDLTFSRTNGATERSGSAHSSHRSASESTAGLGTLMWIGESSSPEFEDAYQHCLASTSQLALRRNFDDALCRPAAAVTRILVAQSTRHPLDRRCLELLRDAYPEASFLNLQGTLCEGMRPMQESLFGPNHHYWHRWNQVLPQWLERGDRAMDHAQAPSDLGCQSVAVLTSSFSAGEALMDLAESAGATAVWCRSPDKHRVRNIDAVWWDDSVASPTSQEGWSERIAAFGFSSQTARHAWIVNAPRLNEHREAIRGGVELVVSKPHRIDCLVAMLTQQASKKSGRFDNVSKAA